MNTQLKTKYVLYVSGKAMSAHSSLDEAKNFANEYTAEKPTLEIKISNSVTTNVPGRFKTETQAQIWKYNHKSKEWSIRNTNKMNLWNYLGGYQHKTADTLFKNDL